MKHNPVGWFEIYVQEMARAQAFYEAVLLIKLEEMSDPSDPLVGMKAFPMDMGRPGASGALVKMSGIASGGNSTLVYFNCDDCAVEAGRVTSSGGRIHREKSAIGEYGFIVLAIDTEGNMFGLHSMN